MRMREPMLTPEQAAAARRAAMQERERLHAAAEERRELILQVRAGPQHQASLFLLHYQSCLCRVNRYGRWFEIARTCAASWRLCSDVACQALGKDALGSTVVIW